MTSETTRSLLNQVVTELEKDNMVSELINTIQSGNMEMAKSITEAYLIEAMNTINKITDLYMINDDIKNHVNQLILTGMGV